MLNVAKNCQHYHSAMDQRKIFQKEIILVYIQSDFTTSKPKIPNTIALTVGLKMSETIKINDRKITTYFWYLWTFLTLLQVSYFWYVFGFQVALQSFLLKVGILSWNFLWTILLCKKSTLRVWKAIFCPKMRQNSQKIAIRILHVAC